MKEWPAGDFLQSTFDIIISQEFLAPSQSLIIGFNI